MLCSSRLCSLVYNVILEESYHDLILTTVLALVVSFSLFHHMPVRAPLFPWSPYYYYSSVPPTVRGEVVVSRVPDRWIRKIFARGSTRTQKMDRQILHSEDLPGRTLRKATAEVLVASGTLGFRALSILFQVMYSLYI